MFRGGTPVAPRHPVSLYFRDIRLYQQLTLRKEMVIVFYFNLMPNSHIWGPQNVPTYLKVNIVLLPKMFVIDCGTISNRRLEREFNFYK